MARIAVLENHEAILVGRNLTRTIVDEIVSTIPASFYVVITDYNLCLSHFPRLIDAFSDRKVNALRFVLPPGESTKSRLVKSDIEDFLLRHHCTRDTCLIALGGGVVGDLVGFVAATFMRGVPVVQIPTTLLAMVDSSIGGKTAVDTPHGKNLIGAFWQPKRIFIDVDYLLTLPKRQLVNGMAEVLKTAAFWDAEFITFLEENVTVFHSNDTNEKLAFLEQCIAFSAGVKAHVVSHDERESGLRGLLNFGHSVGHAIEAVLTPELLHGEAVAVGMIKEAEIARYMGHLDQAAVSRLSRCLKAYGLPISMDDPLLKKIMEQTGKTFQVENLMEIMRVDKKNQGNQKRIVLLSGIGKTLQQKASNVPDQTIRNILAPAVCVHSRIDPFKPVRVVVPGSKSISNRALLLAALAKGKTRLYNLLHSDDTQVMLIALRKLNGCTYTWEENGKVLVVEGSAGMLQPSDDKIYLGNAGTAARFLTTVCTLISKSNKKTVLCGNDRMHQRPIRDLVSALTANGCSIEYLQNEGCLPLQVTHLEPFNGGEIVLSGSISSQFVSSILLSAPYAKTAVTLRLVGSIVSQPYIDMTIAMMKSFGVVVERLEPGGFRIPKQNYVSPGEYMVEPDASSATYPLSVAAITGSECTVLGLGHNSLQGDARFAQDILEKMGCTVTQTATETTVHGPPTGSLKAIGRIDMEHLTDAFLTAAALAAVAPGLTEITGIANQRVKECDRISAMALNLKRCGVSVEEMPDGIRIFGDDFRKLHLPQDGIKCFDDHRVAMSFSVLASVVGGKQGGIIINEKKCVEKTWPTWWETLEKDLQFRVIGCETLEHEPKEETKDVLQQNLPSIVLIGMRGVGKTHLGKAASSNLGSRFIDLDQFFEEKRQVKINDFIQKHGWDAFRFAESEDLHQVLNEYPTNTVIASGGGVVEREENCNSLLAFSCSGGIVIHVKRRIDSIIEHLTRDTSRPAFPGNLINVWNRRKPLYEKVSDYEFVMVNENMEDQNWKWNAIEDDFYHFLAFIVGRRAAFAKEKLNPHVSRQVVDENIGRYSSFFVSLTFSSIHKALSLLKDVNVGSEAVEFRVDLLDNCNDVESVAEQLALLRRFVKIPIIFTVRSKSQGGEFPDDQEDMMFRLLKMAIKWGCELIDMEICWSQTNMEALVKGKKNSLIIASYHELIAQDPWKDYNFLLQFDVANLYGDIIKIVAKAANFNDNFELSRSLSERLNHISKPIIAINMGSAGQLSRILNTCLTPITHEMMPFKAAPGQLTLKEIHHARHLLGLLPSKQFYLFGTPISHSLSPVLHNCGFQMLGLPHVYNLYETNDVDNIEKMIRSANFGGASVTIPNKENVISLLDELTVAAQKIRAVNTIIPFAAEKGVKLIGENTDWIGILAAISARINKTCLNEKGLSVLILGAGGTARAACFAATSLPHVKEVCIWNRTLLKAETLANQFGAKTADFGDHIWDVIISTLPGEAHGDLPNVDALFSKSGPGIYVELAYKPRYTDLFILAKERNWLCVEGAEILVEQGLEQFHLWTGRRPPCDAIKEAVMNEIHRRQ